MLRAVIPAEAGISGGGAGKEPHEIPAFAGMTVMGQGDRYGPGANPSV